MGEEGSGAWARFWSAVWLHLRRAFAWDLRCLPAAPGEREFLDRRQTDEPVLQAYLTWRRSVLFVLCLPALLIAVLGTFDALTDDGLVYTGFGRLWLTLGILAAYAMPAAVVAAALTWWRADLSWRVLAVGWLISFLVPLLLLLVPAHWIFDLDAVPLTIDRHWRELGVRTLFGVFLFLLLCLYLPVYVVSIAQGMQRACLRLKTLIPGSSIPGVFLATSAPVLPLVLLPVFVLVNQVASSPLLILGMFLVMSSSLVYVFFAGLFLRPLTTPAEFRAMVLVQGAGKGMFWLGVLLLLLYAMLRQIPIPEEEGAEQVRLVYKTLLGFTSGGSILRPWDWRVVRWLLIETVGRSLFTTILFADLFMRLSTTLWYHGRRYAASGQAEEYDRVMGTIARRRFGE